MTTTLTPFIRIVILFLVIGVLSVGVFYYQYQRSVSSYEEKVLEQVSQRSHGLAVKQREIVRAKMVELDRVLLTLRDAVNNGHFGNSHFESLMRLQKSYNQEIADFLLLDNTGQITAWTRDEAIPDVSDRDYFQWHLEHTEDNAFISAVQTARVEDPFHFFGMSRKIVNDQGDFNGVIVATVDIHKFSKTLDDQLFDGRLTHVLVSDQSKIIFRLPWKPEFVDSHLKSLDQYGDNIPDSDSYRVQSPFDNLARLVTFQRVPNWPLIVYIGEDLTLSEQLIATYATQEQRRWGAFALLITLLTLVILSLMKRRHDSALEILKQRKALDDYYHRSRAILEAMPDLVFTIDKSGTIIDYQSGSNELLFTTPDRFLGHTFIDVMPHHVAEQGFFLFQQVLNTGSPAVFEYPLTIDNKALYFELRMSKIDDQNILAIARDITQRKDAETKLTWQATHDALTQLPNRVLFYDRLEHAVSLSRRSSSPFALLYIDIDGFKPVNDSLGHNLGDQLLIEFAKRLRNKLRESDTLARLAGDEFAVILFNCESESHAQILIHKLMQLIEEPFQIESHTIDISASIGLVWTACWDSDIDALVNQADQSMYQNKERRKQQNKLP